MQFKFIGVENTLGYWRCYAFKYKKLRLYFKVHNGSLDLRLVWNVSLVQV